MRKFAGLCTLLLFSAAIAVVAVAQDAPQTPAPAPAPAPETPAPPVKRVRAASYFSKYEVAAGYTYRSFYVPTGPALGTTLGMNGWHASLVYNLNAWLGIEGEGTGAYGNQGVNGKTSLYTGMAGAQIFPLKHHKITPWGHALFGVGYYDLTFPPLSPFPSSTISKNAEAWDLGGGIDYFVKRNLGVRVFQLDYDKEGLFNQTSRAGYRISFGVVYRIGGR